MQHTVTSLAPEKYGSNFKSVIFELIPQNSRLRIRCEIILTQMPQNYLTGEKSIVVRLGTVRQQAITATNQPMMTRMYAALWPQKVKG